MAIGLGTIFGDVRIRLDSLRSDAAQSEGVLSKVQQSFTQLGNTTMQAAQRGLTPATRALQESGRAASTAGTQLERASVQARTAATNLEQAGQRAQRAHGWFASILRTGLGVATGGLLAGGAIGVFMGLEHGLTSLIRSGIDANAMLEQQQIAFTTLLGSADKARTFLADMQQFAAVTPFEFPQLVTASQHMLAFGFSAEQIRPMLTAIGDAMAGMGQSGAAVDQVVRIFGQMHAATKVNAGDMMQLTSMGIPAWQTLADAMGLTVPQLQKMVSAGLVPADKALAIFQKSFEDKFGGGMAKQSQTFAGLMSTLQDNIRMALAAFTGPLFDRAKGALEQLGNLVSGKGFQDWAAAAGKAVGSVVDALVRFAQTIGAVIGFFQKNQAALEILKGVLLGVGVALLFLALGAMPSLTASVGALTASLTALWAVAAPFILPVLAIVAGVAALYLAFRYAYENIKPFHDWVERTKVALLALWTNGLSLIGRGFAALGGFIGRGVAWLAQLWAWVGPRLLPVLAQLGEVLQARVGRAMALLSPYVQKAAAALQRFWTEVGPRLLPALRTIGVVVGVLIAVLLAVPITIGFIAFQIISHWRQVQAFLMPAILALAGLFRAVFPGLRTVVVGVFNVIVGVIRIAWAIISGTIRVGLAILSGDWRGAWNGMRAMLAGVWGGIRQVISGALGIIRGIVSAVWGAVSHIFLAGVNLITATARRGFFALIGIVSVPFRAIGALFQWLYAHNRYVQMLVDFIRSRFQAALAVARVVWNAVATTVGSALQRAWATVSSIGSTIWSFLVGLWSRVVAGVRAAWDMFVGAIHNAFGPATSATSAIGGTILDTIMGVGPKLLDAGRHLIQMLIDGISSMLGALGNIAGQAASAIADVLGFHSPTKEGPGRTADRWMPALGEMLSSGLEDQAPKVGKAALRAANALAGAFDMALGLPELSVSGVGSTGTLGSGAVVVHHHNDTTMHLTVAVEPGDVREGDPADVGEAFGTALGASFSRVLQQKGY
jgi:tape measure domain-containing protein